MVERRFSYFGPGQHSSDFLKFSPLVQLDRSNDGSAFADLLFHPVMNISKRRYLWQMCQAENLRARCQFFQLQPYHVSHATAYPRIDLVEDQHLPAYSWQDGLEWQHEAGESPSQGTF